jgi:hypothetical protein
MKPLKKSFKMLLTEFSLLMVRKAQEDLAQYMVEARKRDKMA